MRFVFFIIIILNNIYFVFEKTTVNLQRSVSRWKKPEDKKHWERRMWTWNNPSPDRIVNPSLSSLSQFYSTRPPLLPFCIHIYTHIYIYMYRGRRCGTIINSNNLKYYIIWCARPNEIKNINVILKRLLYAAQIDSIGNR